MLKELLKIQPYTKVSYIFHDRQVTVLELLAYDIDIDHPYYRVFLEGPVAWSAVSCHNLQYEWFLEGGYEGVKSLQCCFMKFTMIR